MNMIIKQVALMERIDQMIRMQATGSPELLAKKLQISRAKLYRTLDMMKALNAPIAYDFAIQSFVYQEAVCFSFGFYTEELNTIEQKNTYAGGCIEKNATFLYTVSQNETLPSYYCSV